MAAPPENAAMIQALDIVGFATAQQGPNNINPAWEFAVHCGLEDLNVMVGMDPADAREHMKDYNRDPDVNFRAQISLTRRLMGLIAWVNDRHYRGIDLTVGVNISQFDADTLERSMVQIKYDADLKASTPMATPIFSNVNNWREWHDQFWACMLTVQGSTGCPLAWIIRSPKPAGWVAEDDAIDEVEKRMYQLQMQDHWFMADKTNVWAHLQTACRANKQAWSFIEPFLLARDGHLAWIAIFNCFEGSGEINRREGDAEAVLRPGVLVYRGEQRGGEFIMIIAKLRQAYSTLEQSGERVIPDVDKVKRLCEIIHAPPGSMLMVEKSTMLSLFRNDFDGAVGHMSIRITEIFPITSIQANQRNSQRRNISQAGNATSANIHGIMIDDIHNVSNSNWHALGRDGQNELRNRRNRSPNMNGRGGRSNYGRGNFSRGRGRGGRFGGGRGHFGGRGNFNRGNYGRGGGGRNFGNGGRGRGHPYHKNNSGGGYGGNSNGYGNSGGFNDNTSGGNRAVNETNGNNSGSAMRSPPDLARSSAGRGNGPPGNNNGGGRGSHVTFGRGAHNHT